MEQFYTFSEQLVCGPFSRDKLLRMIAAAQVSANTPLSQGKGTPWRPLSDYPDLLREARELAGSEMPKNAPPPDQSGAGITFHCPNCSQKYEGDASWLGREVVCRKCQNVFVADDGRHPQPENSSPAESVSPSSGAEIPEGDIICPHCWQKFDSEYLLYIASHPALTGDPLLGSGAMKRFSPSSFNALGQALDPMGAACSELACPRCHLKIPATVIEEPCYYFSLVGAQSSGKSYYLAALLHLLRQKLADQFAYTLVDVDPELNRVLDSYEETIFRSPRRDQVAVLPKTQQTGDDFVDTVLLDNLPVQLPKPFVYEFRSQHSGRGERRRGFNVIFYDNAGEHFQPGADNLTNPGTRHLACSDGIIFIFDPLNDAIMRTRCAPGEPQLASDEHVYEQSKLMSEMIARIRRHRNMSAEEKCSIPLVVAVGKYDAWSSELPRNLAQLNPCDESGGTLNARWRRSLVMDVSFALRELVLQYAPALVHAAEGFFDTVTFIPFSSFGCFSRPGASGQLGVIPAQIAPVWVEEPFLALLAAAGVIEIAPEPSPGIVSPLPVQLVDGFLLFNHPRDGHRVRLPLNYAGVRLHINGQSYGMPSLPGRAADDDTAGGLHDTGTDDLWS